MEKRTNFKGYNRLYRLVRHIICPLIVKKSGFTGEQIPENIGPRFILCNHNTDFDFLLLVSVSGEPMDFVATEAMLRMGFVPGLVARKLHIILHDKGSKGIHTLKQIVGRIGEERSVVLFPEGNRSFDGRTGSISGAVGKIALLTGASLVVYRLTGGYFTAPRWGRGNRKGRMEGKVAVVLTPEEMKKMSPDELQRIIEEGLRTDAYEEQGEQPVRFRSLHRAEYLETLMFICPACGKIGTLKSYKNMLGCACGFSMEMDEYGYLWDNKKDRHSITALVDEQKKLLKKRLTAQDDDMLWKDRVHMNILGMNHVVQTEADCDLTGFNDYLMVGEERLPIDRIDSVDIVQRNRLLIHVKDQAAHYEFTGDKIFNAVKYRIWYERVSL